MLKRGKSQALFLLLSSCFFFREGCFTINGITTIKTKLMKKVYIFYFFFAVISSSFAQDGQKPVAFLEQQAWEEELDLALEQPDTVYKLNASGMGFQELPEAFWGLSQLHWLSLRDNNFEQIPNELIKLPQLSRLDFSNNNIGELPEVLSYLERLTHLDISGNKDLQLEITLITLVEITNLRGLRLRELPIQEFPDLLSEIDSLQYLDISSSEELRFLSPELAKFPALKELELNQMQLDWDSSLIVLAEVGQLESLALAENNWEDLPKGLYKLKQIKTLSLEYNRLETLPEALKELPHLERIYLKGNPIPEKERKDLQENWEPAIKLHFEAKKDSFWR